MVRQNHTSKKQLLQTIRRCPSTWTTRMHIDQCRALKSLAETAWTDAGTCRALRLSSSPCFNNPPCASTENILHIVRSLFLSTNESEILPLFQKKGGQNLTSNCYMNLVHVSFHFIFLPYYWILQTAGLRSMHVQSSRHAMHCLNQCKFLSVLGFMHSLQSIFFQY
jgi:hypothetical protein